MDSKEHKSVSDFVSKGGSAFTLDGQRGEPVAKLCRHSRNGQMECTDIAMEAKDLFAAMQSLNFFCTLPQDPKRTDIVCEKIPQ